MAPLQSLCLNNWASIPLGETEALELPYPLWKPLPTWNVVYLSLDSRAGEIKVGVIRPQIVFNNQGGVT